MHLTHPFTGCRFSGLAWIAATGMLLILTPQPARSQIYPAISRTQRSYQTATAGLVRDQTRTPAELFQETAYDANLMGSSGGSKSLGQSPFYSPSWLESHMTYLFRGGAIGADAEDSTTGGVFGGDLYFLLDDEYAFGTYFSANGAFYEQGRGQFLGTASLFKLSEFRTGNPLSQFGGAVYYDHLTDSRFVDVFYVSQLRLRGWYSPWQGLSLGVLYNEPLRDDSTRISVFTVGQFPVPVSASQQIGGYVSGWIGDWMVLSAEGAYLDDLDSWLISSQARFPVSEKINFVANASYEESNGFWFGGVNVEFTFGRLFGRRPDSCGALAGRSASRDIVRGQGCARGPVAANDVNQQTGGANSQTPDQMMTMMRMPGGMMMPTNGMMMMSNGMMMPPDGMTPNGIDFTNPDCDVLVGQLLEAFNGDTGAVVDALIENMRTECLDDPRLLGST